jgi:hypothetical protein
MCYIDATLPERKEGKGKLDYLENLFPQDQDILFYVKDNSQNSPIYRKEFQNLISNLTSSLGELFKSDKPNPEIPNESYSEVDGFSLKEIELNFTLEAGAKILLLFDGKGSAGIKLVFKKP